MTQFCHLWVLKFLRLSQKIFLLTYESEPGYLFSCEWAKEQNTKKKCQFG